MRRDDRPPEPSPRGRRSHQRPARQNPAGQRGRSDLNLDQRSKVIELRPYERRAPRANESSVPTAGPRPVSRRLGRVVAPVRTGGRAARKTVAWFRRDVAASTPSLWKAGRPRRRLLSVFAVVTVILLGLVTRVALLQTASGATYSDFGEQQRTKDAVISADRGVIFDRDGQELVISVPATTLFANPKLIVDPAATAASIANVLLLSADRRDALARDLAKPKSFVYVAREIDDIKAQAVLALKLKGIGAYDEPTRMYPAGDVAKSLLGRVNVDGQGTAGLEKQYDSLLTGVDGSKVREIDGEGRSIPTGKRVLEQPVPGQDLVLTISRPLQYQAEQALIEQVKLLGARGGQVIVGNTKTGEIYALANVRIDEETGEIRVSSKNIAVTDANEPGSVAKVITIAAAMNEGTITTDSYFQVPGYLNFDGGASRGGITLKDAHPHDLEDMSVETILGVSSNIGTYKVMQTIGVNKHEQYLRSFGLGARSALGFPDEQKGIVHGASTLRGTEAVTVAWGQGVASTSVQLWAAINVIGNKGRHVEPKLVKSIIDAKGTIINTPPSATREVVSESVAKDMTRIMQTVVCKGTGKKAQVPGWDVAGKTGTSYKAQPKGGYKDENGRFVYFASFVGFFPANDPQVTVLVSIDEPPAGGDRFGGTTAAPVFTEIARAAINQLRIAPPVSGGCTG